MDTLGNAVHHATNMQHTLGWSESSGSDFHAATGLNPLTVIFGMIALFECSHLFYLPRSMARNCVHFAILFMCALCMIPHFIPDENLAELPLQLKPMIFLVLALAPTIALFPLASLLAGKLQQNVVCQYMWSPVLSTLLCLLLVDRLEFPVLWLFQGAPVLLLYISFLHKVLQLVLLRDIVSDIACLFPRISSDVHDASTLLAVFFTWVIFFVAATITLQNLNPASLSYASSDINRAMNDALKKLPVGSGMETVGHMVCRKDQIGMNCTNIRLV